MVVIRLYLGTGFSCNRLRMFPFEVHGTELSCFFGSTTIFDLYRFRAVSESFYVCFRPGGSERRWVSLAWGRTKGGGRGGAVTSARFSERNSLAGHDNRAAFATWGFWEALKTGSSPADRPLDRLPSGKLGLSAARSLPPPTGRHRFFRSFARSFSRFLLAAARARLVSGRGLKNFRSEPHNGTQPVGRQCRRRRRRRQ